MERPVGPKKISLVHRPVPQPQGADKSDAPPTAKDQSDAFASQSAASGSKSPLLGPLTAPAKHNAANKTQLRPPENDAGNDNSTVTITLREATEAPSTLSLPKIPLVAASRLFQRMLASQMREGRSQEVTLSLEVPASAWHAVFDAACAASATKFGAEALSFEHACAIAQALDFIDVAADSPQGKNLLALAEACYEVARSCPDNALATHLVQCDQNNPIICRVLAKHVCDRDVSVVNQLDADAISVLLESEPFLDGTASPFLLALTWAEFNCPDKEQRDGFFAACGLREALDWRQCSAPLRQRAVRGGFLPVDDGLRGVLEKAQTLDLSGEVEGVLLHGGCVFGWNSEGNFSSWGPQSPSANKPFSVDKRLGVACMTQMTTDGLIAAYTYDGRQSDWPQLYDPSGTTPAIKLKSPPKNPAALPLQETSGQSRFLVRLRVGKSLDVLSNTSLGAKNYEFVNTIKGNFDQAVVADQKLYAVDNKSVEENFSELHAWDLEKATHTAWRVPKTMLATQICATQKFVCHRSEDGTIRIFDSTSDALQPMTTLTHAPLEYEMNSIAAYGNYVASVGEVDTKIWDAVTGDCLHTLAHPPLAEPDDHFALVSVGADAVVVASYTGIINVWRPEAR